MQTIKKISTIFCLFLISAPYVLAQTGRMERDIRIAEGILTEIFSNERNDFPLLGSNVNTVQSDYIPGAGVHFKIGQNINIRTIRVARNGDIHSDTNDSELTEAIIKEKMIDYLTNYGPLLRDLPGNEFVRLTYGLRSNVQYVNAYFSGADPSIHKVPQISMWVSGADLERYRKDEITDTQLQSRIRVHDFSEAEDRMDLNIFASVLETAIKSVDTEHLQLRRKPTVDYLPGLGAHYQMQINRGSGIIFRSMNVDDIEFNFNVDSLFQANVPRMDFTTDSLRVSIPRETVDSLHRYASEARNYAQQVKVYSDSLRGITPRFMTTRALQTNTSDADPEELIEEMETIMDQIKEILPGYGSTLKSLADDELLLITVNWSWVRDSTLPAKTDIRIKKSDLLQGREPIIEEIKRR